ncbi:MAG: hypothetical protein KDH94_00760 [Coxiellaceae bacterium]|nr:hypothetical protein [Coxiellaceae bacterium]
MKTVLIDLAAFLIALIPMTMAILYLPVNRCLKTSMKNLLIKSVKGKNISFENHSPRLVKLGLEKNPEGKWSLLTRYFFCYQEEDKQISGQAIVNNKTLVDIQFYPTKYQNAKNDEHITKKTANKA